MLRSGNVATPAEAAACDLPERRPLGTLGSLPSASVTSPVKLVTTLPAESNTVTCTGGWMMLSFMASVGGAVNASLVERSEEHTSELQSPCNLVCRLLLEKKNTLYRHGMDCPSPRTGDGRLR